MNDDQWVKMAETLMLIALACGMTLIVGATFHILSVLNKCP